MIQLGQAKRSRDQEQTHDQSAKRQRALGALAGFTIFLGLPLGRLQVLSARTRVALAMFSVGVLAFLVVDVFEHGIGIVEHAVEQFSDDETGIGKPLGLCAVLALGFCLGTAALAMTEARMRRRPPTPRWEVVRRRR